MKKAVLLGLFLGVVNYATAQIWSETFSTNAPPTLNDDSSADITNEWPRMEFTARVTSNPRVEVNPGGRETLRIRVNQQSGHQGKSIGASIALDGSLFTGAGTYRLNVDIADMQFDGTLGVGIYGADIGSGGSNNYYTLQNVNWGGPGTNNITTVKIKPAIELTTDAYVTLLAQKFFNSSHNGVRSIDFTYDGFSDVAIMLTAISETSSASRWVEIDAVSVDAATPNPDVPSFTSATNVVPPGPVQDVYYSNDVFVTSVTLNPGLESLFYSARSSAPGLSVSPDGTIFGTPTQGGTNTMIISVADSDGAYDEAVFILVVDDVDDPPEFYSPPAYGDNIFWAGNALVGVAYSADLNGYVGDPEGAELTFSGSGPSWLTIAPDGTVSGTPGPDDYLQNSFEIIASDGGLSSTGKLNIAVEKKNVYHFEGFDTNAPPTVIGQALATFPGLGGEITTTQSNGNWYKAGGGGSSVHSSGTLRFARPSETDGGMSGCSIVFDEALFVDGAGTHQIKLNVEHITQQANIFYEVYDVDFGVSGEVSVSNVTYVFPAFMPPVTVTNDATATLLTNVQSSGGGLRTIEFDYDGTGDVLVRIGAGRNNAADWWVMQIDNFKLLGPSLVTPLQTWAFDFGMKGAAADAANDPNGDGWPLLYDYGLGLNPIDGTPDGGAHPTYDMGASGMVYVHALRKDDPSLVYSIETNPNLTDPGGWSSADYVTGINVTTGAFNYVTNTIPTTDPEKFIRLKIEE